MEYQAGGGLPPRAESYVKRKADDELIEGLSNGEFCYVLNARQMGKSSLRSQTEVRLRKEETVCAVIDLQEIGKQVESAEQWCAGFGQCLVSEFELSGQLRWQSWWKEHTDLSPVQRLGLFIQEMVLRTIRDRKIVILIDEIDSVLGLPFSLDDFFGWLRSCHQRKDRPDYKPEYQRLTFALFGVATPSSLIQDKTRTPFNIGKAILLEGFRFDEARGLAQGLINRAERPEVLLREILEWTGGQPFLTQKLCQIAQREAGGIVGVGHEKTWIEQLVRQRVITNWGSQDEPEHLRTIQNRLLLQGDKTAGRSLGLYREILQQGGIEADDASPDHTELRLSGLVVKHTDQLQVFNPIYRAVFNLAWVEQQLAELRDPFYAEAFNAWLKSDKRDLSLLLRGQALQKALAWRADRSLSRDDEEFLAASQQYDRQEVQRKLDAEAKAKQILEEANRKAQQALQEEARARQNLEIANREVQQILRQEEQARQNLEVANREAQLALESEEKARENLEKINRKAQQRIRLGIGVLAVTTSAAVIAGIRAASAINEATQAQQEAEKARKEVTQAGKDRDEAIAARNTAEQQRRKSISELERTKVEFSNTKQALKATEAERLVALRQAGNARRQARLAAAQERRARIQAQQANQNRKLAEDAAKTADRQKKQAEIERKVAQEGTRLERAGTAAINLFQFEQAEGLFEALKSVIELRKVAGKKNFISDYPTTGPILALQTLVNASQQTRMSIIDFSPNGQIVAVAGEDGTVRLWDLKGKELALKGHQGSISSVDFSPTGQMLATQGEDGTVRLWDLKGNELAQFQVGAISSINFSPNGQMLATQGEDGTVRLWDLKGNELAQFQAGAISSVDFSPTGQMLATQGEDGTVRLWDLKGNELAQLQVGAISPVDFSPTGQILATQGKDGVRLWDLKGNELDLKIGNISSVVFSPTGQMLATQEKDGVRLWDLKGNELAQLKVENISSVVFSPNGQMLATDGEDATVRLWDLKGNELAQLSLGVINLVVFSPNGQMLATDGENGVHLWDLKGNELAQLKGHQGSIASINFSPNGRYIFTGSHEGDIRDPDHSPDFGGSEHLWDLQGNELAQLKVGNISSVVFSPNGQMLATRGEDSTVRLWNLKGDELAQLKVGNISSVVFSPTGQMLATQGEDSTVHLWNLKGDELAQLKVGNNYSVAFNPTGQILATGGEDGTVRLWNLKGNELAQLKGHRGYVGSVIFSPNGQMLATQGEDGTVRLWNLKGNELAQLKGHQGSTDSVIFSPNGQMLATQGEDNTVRFWDSKGRQIAQYDAAESSISPDWKWIVTINTPTPLEQVLMPSKSSNIIKIWAIDDLDSLIVRACQKLKYHLEESNGLSETDRDICDGFQ